jgi:F-type H+-transporting ATPase subunit b
MSLAALFAEDPARTHHWLLPETFEIIYGGIASLIVFGALYKFAGPMIAKAMSDRTARIQGELEASAADKAAATSEAADIRQAAGDIDAERQRLLTDADAQADAVLAEGRGRLEQEIADLEARAEADLVSADGRANEELRAEISRLANQATDHVLANGALDATVHQDLIEAFIAKVGAGA